MERRSRKSRYPAEGKGKRIDKPSPMHQSTFKRLDPFCGYKFMTPSWNNYFEGLAPAKIRDEKGKVLRETPIYMSQQMGILYGAPNLYLGRHPSQEDNSGFWGREAVYHLDDAGYRYLEKLGYVFRDASHRARETQYFFEHEFMVDLGFYAPLEYAAREDKAFRRIDTRELFEHPNFPAATRESESPFIIDIDGDRVALDGRPVVLGRVKGTQEAWICIPGIQVERNRSKGVRVKDPEKASVGRHVRHAIAAHRNGTYKKHFGFSRFMLPFIFTDAAHERLTLDYIGEQLPGGCQFIITKTIPDLAKLERFPKPSSDFFLSAWHRAGYDDFKFDDAGFFK